MELSVNVFTDPDNNVATALNMLKKYVASTTMSRDDATWNNSTLLGSARRQHRHLRRRGRPRAGRRTLSKHR